MSAGGISEGPRPGRGRRRAPRRAESGQRRATRPESGTGGAGSGRAAAGSRRGRRAQQTRLTRRGRIVAWTCAVLAVLVVLGGGAATWIYQKLDGNINEADIDGRLGDNRPVSLSPGAKNILVVGSDSRDGTDGKYGKGFETMQSDTLMVVHISADRDWASVVSLPRDSWVEIPSCDKGNGNDSKSHHSKINESFAIGGMDGDIAGAAACTIRTVEHNTGLRMDHFMSMDFQGFKGMVDALDGVEVCLEEPIDDKKAHLKLPAGCQTIKGEDALGYVRARYSVGDGSDTSRIGRQQEFMDALAAKAKSKLTNGKAMYSFMEAFTGSLTTDPKLAGVRPLYDLAREVQGIPTKRLTFLTVPNYPRERDVPTDKANVVWQYPQAETLFTSLAKDKPISKKKLEQSAEETAALTPSQIRVNVLNGTDTAGKAAEVAEQLRAAGFQVATTGNAPTPTERTTIGYPQGLRSHASVLSGRVPGSDTKAGGGVPGVLTLTIGDDFRGLRS
ncbi:LCP family protein [Streptomyces sp. XM4193]|uniref:LCP family protein n=1 Tax=Streptomyces sp. XM4193 TaxID=2929782 RepID=UPI001FFB3BEE|nr:LCP family protein [Streptomyces sp. XM4193]MCK1794714.1 LCP family protein [Streptomyces sp. XM4193]